MRDLGGLQELIFEQVKAMNESGRAAYQAGRAAGYRQGFREGIAAAQRIVDAHLSEALGRAQAGGPTAQEKSDAQA